MKKIIFSLLAMLSCVASYGQVAAISGPHTICGGTPATYSDATAGGVWSSSTPSIVMIGSTTGVATGLAIGATTISYTVGGSSATYSVTVAASPAAITGVRDMCSFSDSMTVSDATGGGYWSSTLVTISPTGDVHSFAAGMATISYTLSSGCSSFTTLNVNPSPTPLTLTGGGTYCSGTSILVSLTASVPGTSYQLFNGITPVGSAIAGTGGPISIPITSSGTYTVIATDMTTGCVSTMMGSATVSIVAPPTAYSVIGGGSYCAGAAGVLVDISGSDAGIYYQLYNGAAAVGTPVLGTGTSISFGVMTAPGVYTVTALDPSSGCNSAMTGSATVTINPLPTAYTVTGGGSYCSGGSGVSIGLSNSDAGVDYSLVMSGTIATASGTGSAISFGLITTAGTDTVIATNTVTGCTSFMTGSATVTVSSVVVPSVSIVAHPGTTICYGATDTFVAVVINGGSSPTYSWQVNGSVTGSASNYTYIPANGDVVGVYVTSSASCASPTTASTTVIITVDSPVISATSSVACGGVNTLMASGGTSYSWSPTTGLSCGACSNPTVLPTSTTTYTVTGTDAAGCTGTATVTANGNTISGYISYSGGSSTDSFRVWLIQYDPTDSSIVATDSTVSCMDGGIPYYEFNSPAAGSYLVKAALFGAVPGTSGYIPTYGLSSAYWYSASGISHSSSADSMHINMISGTVPSGPGFISGYVYAGAGKGTTGDAPDPGILIYLKDATTGNVITYTYTDASGLFSFSSIGYGTYIIFPESYKYHTTPSAVINISATSTSVTGIDFRRSTTLSTIKPKPAGIQPITNIIYYIAPNPTNGDVSVTWPVATGDAVINVTDLTGRTVYYNVFNANAGKANVSMAGLQNGIYFIAVKTDNYNYGTKLLIQK